MWRGKGKAKPENPKTAEKKPKTAGKKPPPTIVGASREGNEKGGTNSIGQKNTPITGADGIGTSDPASYTTAKTQNPSIMGAPGVKTNKTTAKTQNPSIMGAPVVKTNKTTAKPQTPIIMEIPEVKTNKNSTETRPIPPTLGATASSTTPAHHA